MGETDLKNKILAIVEEEDAQRAAYALKLLQSEAVLTIASTGKDPATGKLVTLYSTGMRRLELANLKLYDLDTERGTVSIRQGKGKKDRVIPIGDRAAAWIEKYIRESRPQLVVEPRIVPPDARSRYPWS
jgi:site-specific recombinase XerD